MGGERVGTGGDIEKGKSERGVGVGEEFQGRGVTRGHDSVRIVKSSSICLSLSSCRG